jgi:penicillin-binding protein 2
MEIAGQDAELPEIRLRSRVFAAVVLIGLFGLLGRVFYLQIVLGEHFHRITSESVVSTVGLPAFRGEIRDRRGRLLATTRPSYDVVVTPGELTRESYGVAVKVLGGSYDNLLDWERLRERARREPRESITFAEDVTDEQMAALATSMDLPGVSIRAEARRRYPHGPLFAHAIGYLNEITADELRKRKQDGYRPGELVGRTGLERRFETHLRGRRGYEKIVLDRRNRPLPGIHVSELVDGPVRQEPIPGHNLVLTLDLDVQQAIERALEGRPVGGVVVLDVKTGAVLGLVSRPTYDPNRMSGRLTADEQARLLSDPYRPFRDKTLADTYNPGSTFKVVSAAAALEDKILTPDQRARCTGSIEFGRRKFRCTHVHGVVDLHDAIVASCNVYFYQLGTRPDMLDRLTRYATEFGLGSPSGLGINTDSPGVVPSEEMFRKIEGRANISAGHALNTVIGEGDTRATVMQIALLYGAIANQGQLMVPRIVDRIETADGKVVERFAPTVRRRLPVSAETLAVVRSGLQGVVAERHGTAYATRSSKVTVAGKTGTAQTEFVLPRQRDGTPGKRQKADHAWFAGYAPADDPQIAFAIVIEHGGFGGQVSAPVAVKIAESVLGPGGVASSEPQPRVALPFEDMSGED